MCAQPSQQPRALSQNGLSQNGLSQKRHGTCQIAMLNVSDLMYRAEGCAMLRRAKLRCAMPRLCCSVALWIESSFASLTELI
eukprot:9572-Pyramimonas_sp.AAC.1